VLKSATSHEFRVFQQARLRELRSSDARLGLSATGSEHSSASARGTKLRRGLEVAATNNHLTSRFRRLHLQADLRLGPGDLAEIKVYGAPELSDTLRVSSGGEIAMPLIGVVKVAGLTPEQVQKEIAQRLLVGGFFARPARQHPH
jgi:protein involved in polysaccharide export with SLBB domain